MSPRTTRSLALLTFVWLGSTVLAYHGRPLWLPLVLASIAAALVIPLEQRLSRRLPASIASGLAAAVPLPVLTLLLLTCMSIFQSQQDVLVEALGPLGDSLQSARSTLDRWGVRTRSIDLETVSGPLSTLAQQIGSGISGMLFTLLLAQFFLLLGLLERRAWLHKLGGARYRGRIQRAASAFGERVRAYYITRSIACLLSGLVCFGLLTLLGVPGAGALAVATALLNYLPTLGAFLSAGPCVLVAYGVGGPSLAFVTAGSLFAMEQLIGNFNESEPH